MLILIVVAAAIALAAFVASYEKQVLAEESQSQQRALESLKILSVTPVLSSTEPSVIASFSFVLASEYINPSEINSITLNGLPLKQFWGLNVTGSVGGTVRYSTPSMILTARQEVVVTVNLSAPGGNYTYFSLYDDSFLLTTSEYLEISLYTQLQNTFTEVFIPPTAVGFVTELTSYSGGSPTEVPLLDGTPSFQPGGNASIVQWSWTVFDANPPSADDQYAGNYLDCSTGEWAPTVTECIGAEVELSTFASGNSGDFVANLTVTNSDQLSGEVSVPFVNAPS